MFSSNTVYSENSDKTYTKMKRIGKGQYGDVFMVTDEQNNQFAMKLVKLDQMRLDKKMMENFYNEIKIMKIVDHPRILKLFDKVRQGSCIALITLYCDGGNLEDLIIEKHRNGLGEEKAT